tara:strand:+ start:766 stop:1830 length:1065 start_codon:yes stop_codon:yes gene_type:complete
MAFTTIDDPSAHHQTAIYTGSSSSVTVTNDGNSDLQPDWVWIKRRNSTNDHNIFDSSRGFTKRLWTNQNSAENTDDGTGVTVHSDGFATGTYWGDVNNNGSGFVGWQWKANGGTRTTFTESGNNPAGGHQANTTAGFSIVDYTGTGSAGTVAHGLGAVPHTIWVQNRDEGEDWAVYHRNTSAAGNDSYLRLNTNDGAATAGTVWNDTSPTSTVFTVGSNNKTNKDGVKYIAYCFTSIKGYSKFGDYQGNGNDNGPFVFTGFKPAWLMIKRTTANQWGIFDNTISPFNEIFANLDADSNSAENTATNYDDMDFLSNGFRLREENDDINADGGAYVYFAFAEHPFVSSKGIPTTAR